MNRAEFEEEFESALKGVKFSQEEIDKFTRPVEAESMVVHFKTLDEMAKGYTLDEIATIILAMRNFASTGEDPVFEDRGLNSVWIHAKDRLISDRKNWMHSTIINRMQYKVAQRIKESQHKPPDTQRNPAESSGYPTESDTDTVDDTETVNDTNTDNVIGTVNVSVSDSEGDSKGEPILSRSNQAKLDRIAEQNGFDFSLIPEETLRILAEKTEKDIISTVQALAFTYPQIIRRGQ